ncbi:MAG: hypothetical protein GX678_04850 [Actinomycetales bacterium]|nr:hypothetical protein [Actinomycetales bacterium]
MAQQEWLEDKVNFDRINSLANRLSSAMTENEDFAGMVLNGLTSLEVRELLSNLVEQVGAEKCSVVSLISDARPVAGVAENHFENDLVPFDWHLNIDTYSGIFPIGGKRAFTVISNEADLGSRILWWTQVDQESAGGFSRQMAWTWTATGFLRENMWTYPGVGMKWSEARADRRNARRDPVGRAFRIIDQLQPGEVAQWDLDEFFLPGKIPSVEKVDDTLCRLFAEADPRVTIEVFINECEDCEHSKVHACWRFEPPRIHVYTHLGLTGRDYPGVTTFEPNLAPTIFPRLDDVADSVFESMNRHVSCNEEEVTPRTVWNREARS